MSNNRDSEIDQIQNSRSIFQSVSSNTADANTSEPTVQPETVISVNKSENATTIL